MENKLRLKKDNIIMFLGCVFIIVVVAININIFENNSAAIVFAFLFFELMLSFVQKKIRRSIPVLIIQVTGIVRYIIIPMVIGNESMSYSNRVIGIMIYELVGIYLGIIIYSIIEKKSKHSNLEKKIKLREMTNQRLGISAIITMIVGGIYVIMNRSYIERYFSFSINKSEIIDVSGGISIIVAIFFLILFIKSLEFIYKLPIKDDFIKVILSILISIFYINGSSIVGKNVSRWSMIISAMISFIYISRLYPRYKKIMKILLVVCIMFAISIGSLLKFKNSNNGYNNLKSVLRHEIKYKTLNAYFAGNKNMEIGLELSDAINMNNIPKMQIIISDVFANFPILNKYLSNAQRQMTTLFNYKYYNSSIACDQIMPYSIQIYIYFKYFFILFEALQIYLALKLYNKIDEEENFLKIYSLMYLVFSFSLVNCINLSIVFQNLWIHVLPVYIIYSLNIRVKKYGEKGRLENE